MGDVVLIDGPTLAKSKIDSVRLIILASSLDHINKIVALDIDKTRYHIVLVEETFVSDNSSWVSKKADSSSATETTGTSSKKFSSALVVSSENAVGTPKVLTSVDNFLDSANLGVSHEEIPEE